MTVHILAPTDKITSLNCVVAKLGFLAMGEEVRLFEEEAFDEVDLQTGDIVVGGVHFPKQGMQRLGFPVPDLESIPDELMAFSGRRTWRSSMGELRARVQAGEVIFAKPRPDRLKLFTGQVFSSFSDLIPTANLTDDEPLDCAEPVRFVAESRCFVLRGDPMDLRPYKGDPLTFPDPDIIRQALAAYRNAPSAYAMDFGVLADGSTVVVEVNDGYGVGAYGLPPLRYAQLIAARWDEVRALAG